MAKVILDQLVYLKQPACDYLSHIYEVSHKLCDLIEVLKLPVTFIQAYLKSAHIMLNRRLIPVGDLIALNLASS